MRDHDDTKPTPAEAKAPERTRKQDAEKPKREHFDTLDDNPLIFRGMD